MEQKRKYLVFLDVDGVFTSSRVHNAHGSAAEMWTRFDPIAVDFMNKIYDRYPVEFVIMSTWKNFLVTENHSTTHLMEAVFRSAGFRGKFASPWKTDPDNVMLFNRTLDRGDEVQHYLTNYGQDIVDFILFDDNRYNFDRALGKKRLVQTDHENGLLYKHMLNAQSLMGTWHEK